MEILRAVEILRKMMDLWRLRCFYSAGEICHPDSSLHWFERAAACGRTFRTRSGGDQSRAHGAAGVRADPADARWRESGPGRSGCSAFPGKNAAAAGAQFLQRARTKRVAA